MTYSFYQKHITKFLLLGCLIFIISPILSVFYLFAQTNAPLAEVEVAVYSSNVSFHNLYLEKYSPRYFTLPMSSQLIWFTRDLDTTSIIFDEQALDVEITKEVTQIDVFEDDYLNDLRNEILSIDSFENYDENNYSYDLNILLRIAQAEANNQTVDGSRAAIAEIVINRILSDYADFSNFHTVEDVVFAPRQFTPVSTGLIWTTTVDETTFEEVKEALNGSNYTSGAHFFMNVELVSQSTLDWFYTLEYKVDIQDHQFRG